MHKKIKVINHSFDKQNQNHQKSYEFILNSDDDERDYDSAIGGHSHGHGHTKTTSHGHGTKTTAGLSQSRKSAKKSKKIKEKTSKKKSVENDKGKNISRDDDGNVSTTCNKDNATSTNAKHSGRHLFKRDQLEKDPVEHQEIGQPIQLNKRKKAQANTVDRNYDTGAFTAAEKDSVQKALNSYLGEHDVPIKDLHFLLHPREPLLKAGNPYLRQEVLKKFPEKIAEIAGMCLHELTFLERGQRS